MDENLYNHIKGLILIKLMNRNMWEHKHTSINNISKGLDPQLKGTREMKRAINDMIKEGWLHPKPTHYGLELSLNIKKKKNIEDFIEKNL